VYLSKAIQLPSRRSPFILKDYWGCLACGHPVEINTYLKRRDGRKEREREAARRKRWRRLFHNGENGGEWAKKESGKTVVKNRQ